MRRGSLALAFSLACEAAPTPRPEPSHRPPQHPEPPTEPRGASDPEVADPDVAAPEAQPAAAASPDPTHALQPAPASLCVRMCEAQGQARAMAAEAISRECSTRCENRSDSPCDASEARKRVESVPMKRRAAKAWSEFGDPAFYCGYQDALTRGLRTAATPDLASRQSALWRALDADPYPSDTCPAAAEVASDATAAQAIAACGLEEPHADWDEDVDAASYLALRAVRLRLEAAGLDGADRRILLDTALLSTALERKP